MNNNCDFSIVIPCSRNDALFLPKTITYLRKFYENDIYIITSIENHKYLRKTCRVNNLEIIDENSIIPGLSYKYVANYLSDSPAGKRPGWYYQQLLKYAFPFSFFLQK